MNDTDADSDPLEVIDVSQPEVGSLAFNKSSHLVYRSTEGFIGSDYFKYTATDNWGGAAIATATVRINVCKSEVVSFAKTQLVNFISDEAELTEISKAKVETIIEQIKQAEDITTEIYTHSDNIGSNKSNLALSARGAEALKNLLTCNGINSADITAVGIG